MSKFELWLMEHSSMIGLIISFFLFVMSVVCTVAILILVIKAIKTF